MREWAEYQVEDEGGARTVRLNGPLRVSSIGVLDRELRALDEPVQRIDLSGSDEMDTVGAWVVLRFAGRNDAEVTGANKQAQTLMDAVRNCESSAPIKPQRPPIFSRVFEHVGTIISELFYGSIAVLGFLGSIIVAFGSAVAHRRFRYRALVRQMELVGVTSLPIIGLMSFLIGIVIAQQGAVQLQQFGAETLTINLVGRITMRELGVLMTAIMVAGRSGSAFAAQIGTMKLTEEIDAMRTIGVSPIEALVLPRVLAGVVMMPLLGFFASVVAILGGAVVGDAMLGIPFLTFLARIQEVVPLNDFWVGFIKAPVFGLIVALTGCYQGMQVEGNSEDVGLRTTKAVVQAIFMVFVLDAFFAVFFSQIGWI